MPQSWLDDFVNRHKRFESPLSFWRWSAICAASAVLKDSVYLEFDNFSLYPNIYVMLHADSGLKKGPPVNAAKKLVKEVGNTAIISGRSSIQGILSKLGKAESQPGGRVKKGSSAFICSSELTSSIVDDPAATDLLTDLYDRSYNAGEWNSLLKSDEFALRDVTLTMLSATNDAHSTEFFEKKDVAGGFLARTFIIQESKENRPNSLIVRGAGSIVNYAELAGYLKQIAQLKGPFAPLGGIEETEQHRFKKYNEYDQRDFYYSEAGIVYENWYEEFKKNAVDADDKTGTLNRLGASVLKVAMILSLCERPVLEISESAMLDAIELCEKLVGNIRKVTFGRQDQDPTDALRKKCLILELMQRENRTISRAQLVKKYWMHGTHKDWDETVVSLAEAEIIDVKHMSDQVLLYEMKEQAYKDFKKRLEGVKK